MNLGKILKSIGVTASVAAGCIALGTSVQAAVVTEDLFFNYVNGPEELSGERILVGQMTYDDAAFELFDPFAQGGIFGSPNSIGAAPGETYDEVNGDPLNSLTLSVRLFGADFDDPSNPEFTHLHDIDFPGFPQLNFETVFSFDPQTEEEVISFVPLFLDYIVEISSPNGAGALLAAAGIDFGFTAISPLIEVSSFDADVEFLSSASQVPVPAPFALLFTVLGGFGLLAFRRKRISVA